MCLIEFTRDVIYRSKVVKNHINPLWDAHEIDTEILCNHDFNKRIRIQVWDHVRKGKQHCMGQFETDVEKLIDSKSTCGNADSTSAFILKSNNLVVGKIIVVCAEILKTNNNILKNDSATIERPTIYDYVHSGCNISVSVAIDYSSNNGK